MPLTKNVGHNMRELRKAHPDWPYKKRLAASLNAARSKGASIPKRRKKKR